MHCFFCIKIKFTKIVKTKTGFTIIAAFAVFVIYLFSCYASMHIFMASLTYLCFATILLGIGASIVDFCIISIIFPQFNFYFPKYLGINY